MAQGKLSFLAYCDWEKTFEMLTDEEAGKLIKHLLAYVNDKNPILEDRMLSIIFEPIKQQLKRDLKKYESKCGKNRDNILKRWNNTNTNAPESIPNDTTEYNRINSNTNHTDNDNDNDNDNDSDNDINNSLSKESLFPPEQSSGDNVVKIPFSEIKDLWNTTCKDFPRIITLSEARRNKIRVRIEEMGGYEKAKDILKQIFTSMQTSKFLKGDNRNGWRATFDWIVENDKNWVKVFEGNYEKTVGVKTGANAIISQTKYKQF